MSMRIEPGSIAAQLDINKDPEQMANLISKCYQMFSDNSDAFANTCLALVADQKEGALLIHIAPWFGNIMGEVSKEFFTLGFIKGICYQEETAKLEKMMGSQ